MLSNDAVWSLGVKFGLPALILVVLVLVAIIVAAWRSDDEDAHIAGVTCTIFLVVTLIGAGVAYWPFSSEFHKWYDVSGTVEMTNKRLISDGKSMSERYVIKFKESPTLYGCDDTRCSLTTPGKSVTLACKREWQYNAVAGWVCNYKQEG